MKKLLLLPLFLLAVLQAEIIPLDINGTFRNPGNKAMPDNWVMHDWGGFKPFPQVNAVSDGKKNGIRITNVTSKAGIAVRTVKRYPGEAGDQVKVTFTAKGRGRIWIQLYNYADKGVWNTAGAKYHFDVTGMERDYTVFVPVENRSNGRATTCFNVVFGAVTGTEVTVTGIKADLVKEQYKGDFDFPQTWTVFAPVPEKAILSEQELCSVPAELAGKKPILAKLSSSTLDFAQFHTKADGKRACSWAFAKVTIPKDMVASLGAGADWWMTVYVNGKPVIHTFDTAKGNDVSPYEITNHTANVNLKKGENIIAVRHKRGDASALLKIGGPRELRKLSSRPELLKVLQKEDYENAGKARTGAPEIIQGNPAPGLLSLTNQARYRTDGKITFMLDNPSFEMKKLNPGEYFTMGIQVQNLSEESGQLTIRASGKEETLSLILTGGQKVLSGKMVNRQGKVLSEYSVPRTMLPVGVTFSVSPKGELISEYVSLSNSAKLHFRSETGKAFSGTVRLEYELSSANGKTAVLTADDLFTGISGQKTEVVIPHKLEMLKTFDPAKAGWKLVFSDDFNGDKLDLNKWYYRRNHEELIRLDGKGHAVLTVTWDKDHKKLIGPSFATRERYGYGWFEARVRFTRQPGWWAAFWLYGATNTNPFIDGYEIDVFEDYYTRPEGPGKPFRKKIDHNLHVLYGGVTKSWNFNSQLSGSLDDFYTIAVRWTPFELSYYMDGKLIQSEANHTKNKTITFDAFNHNTSISRLHAIVSTQIMKDHWWSKAKDGVFPEEYLVDHVRIYEMPMKNLPEIRWIKGGEDGGAHPGDTLIFEVEANPSPVTKSPLKAVYLFDSGALIDYKTEPPYRFKVPFTQAHYDNTNFSKGGRQNVKPMLRDFHHAFAAFVQDEEGKVAWTKPVSMRLFPDSPSRPYQGKAQKIPGVLKVAHYDEGGQNCAYFDTTFPNLTKSLFRREESVDCTRNDIGYIARGEWINYTVEVMETGKYEVTAPYGTIYPENRAVHVYVDEKLAGSLALAGAKDAKNWAIQYTSKPLILNLTKGKHVIMLAMEGNYNLGNITFRKIKE